MISRKSVPEMIVACAVACAVALGVALGVALAFGVPARAGAQVVTGFGARSILRGSVVDDADEKPIAGASVSIEALKLQAVTDSAGNFRIPYVPAGKYVVVVRRLGFGPLNSLLTFGAADTLEYDFALVKQAANLPEVAVNAAAPVSLRLREFEERRLAGFGRFVTPEVLVKNQDRRLSEVMAMLPGPRVVRGTGSNGWIASSVGPSSIQRRFKPQPMDINRGADPKQCYAAVMLDGNLVFSGRSGELLFDVNSLSTNTVAAIEYYRDAATVPMKFNVRGEETCGLVVIWTK